MIKRIAQAWAFASILLLPNYVDLTSGSGDARMRVAQPLTRIALAHLTDMLFVALVFFFLMAGLRRLWFWPRLRWWSRCGRGWLRGNPKLIGAFSGSSTSTRVPAPDSV